jgi:NAD(P)H-hydrate epimerase
LLARLALVVGFRGVTIGPMTQPTALSQPSHGAGPLPLEDPLLRDPDLDLPALVAHWAANAARRPITAEQMRGADARAQRLGVAGRDLMEQAGFAVAATARAALRTFERPSDALVLVLAGPGNNGGDGFVAARHLAAAGVRCVVALVSTAEAPQARDALLNWERLDGLEGVERMHTVTHHDVAILLSGLERAALIVDALLGTGIRGPLREPVRSAVELCLRARRLGVPVVSVDTPTALDVTSGQPSDPVVAANVTVTFHRPKEGLLTRYGRQLAGRVLVAPIGIPSAADPT